MVEVADVIEDFVVVVVIPIDLHQVYLIGFKILLLQLHFKIDQQHNHHGKTIIIRRILRHRHSQVLHILEIIIQIYDQHNNHLKEIILLIAFFLGCNLLTFFVINKKRKTELKIIHD